MRVEHTASTTSDLPGIASGREDMCNVRVNVGAGLARLDSDYFPAGAVAESLQEPATA